MGPTLLTEVYEVVSEEVYPVAIEYLRDNSVYLQMEQVGIQEPKLLVDEIITNFDNSASLTPQQVLSSSIVNNTLSMQSFATDLQSLILNYYSASNFPFQIDQLQNTYLNQISDSVEALAIINGCETAKASYLYWGDSLNTNYWDNNIYSRFYSDDIIYY